MRTVSLSGRSGRRAHCEAARRSPNPGGCPDRTAGAGSTVESPAATAIQYTRRPLDNVGSCSMTALATIRWACDVTGMLCRVPASLVQSNVTDKDKMAIAPNLTRFEKVVGARSKGVRYAPLATMPPIVPATGRSPLPTRPLPSPRCPASACTRHVAVAQFHTHVTELHAGSRA